MTICIAAICSWGDSNRLPGVVGASDRMLTAGDIEFAPTRSKVTTLTNRIVVLTAGDTSAQTTICDVARHRILGLGVSSVAAAADIVAQEFAALRRRRAENDVLWPLGLDVSSFLKEQHSLSPELVATLARDLKHARLGAEMIVAGVDDLGGHLYLVEDPGQAICFDSIGFVTTGSGGRHAGSQFMLYGYAAYWPMAHALLLTHVAKKRSEVAPGVGDQTDLFFIGSYYQSLDFLLPQLADQYHAIKKAELEAWVKANEQFAQSFQAVVSGQQAQAPRDEIPGGESDPAELPEGADEEGPTDLKEGTAGG